VIYLRIPWSCIEPEEGRFAWSVLDTPAQRWVAKGKQVAFRITASESWTRWATPKWVHDAGAKGYDFRPGKGVQAGGPFWEPDFDDPVFLRKLDRFLAAMAARYDGSPEVAFVDVGSLGVWGEGHTWPLETNPFPEHGQPHRGNDSSSPTGSKPIDQPVSWGFGFACTLRLISDVTSGDIKPKNVLKTSEPNDPRAMSLTQIVVQTNTNLRDVRGIRDMRDFPDMRDELSVRLENQLDLRFPTLRS
jgi:hypothetical protein